MYERLCEENRALVMMCAKRYRRVVAMDRAASMEDMIQQGMLGLIRAAQTFDPNAGKSWAGWAIWHVDMEIQKALRLRRHKFINLNMTAISLETPITEDGETLADVIEDVNAESPAESAERKDRAAQTRKAVARIKSRKTKSIMTALLDGKKPRDIARALKTNERQIYATAHRAREMLKKDKVLIECVK